uniref:MNNL domain-containing protein n=1 Tax=Gongylonema pulchrum TaxID=637853 RepID=A0A183DSH1_9BILA
LQCSCAGSFEIRLVSLTLGSKKDFRPEFRICLKQFERRISHNGECTFGEVTLDAERLRNSTKIEFQFGWPVCPHSITHLLFALHSCQELRC